MLFDEELRLFRARTTEPGYDALILLGTGQSTTAALLLGTLKLQRVGFLLSDETRALPQQVAAQLGCASDSWTVPAGDHSTTLRVYEGLRQILESWPEIDRSAIAVDVTGGLKPMSLGIEKAAHVLGLQTIYLQSDYERGPDGKHRPVPGTQHLVVPPDPYIVFGDLEAAEAQRLFRAHDYSGARRMYQRLASHVQPAARFEQLAQLAEAYAAWDSFDLPAASHEMTCLRERLEPGLLQPHEAVRLEHQHAALSLLTGAHVTLNDAPFDILSRDVATTLALLGSLYANALRREEQGRYDVAALLLYRCLELMSQRRLAARGIDADKERITLLRGYQQLEAARDTLVWQPKGGAGTRLVDRIRATTAARNKSLLAHGFRLIRRDKEYLPFKAVVDDVLAHFYEAEPVREITGVDLLSWRQRYQFVSLEQGDATHLWRR